MSAKQPTATTHLHCLETRSMLTPSRRENLKYSGKKSINAGKSNTQESEYSEWTKILCKVEKVSVKNCTKKNFRFYLEVHNISNDTMAKRWLLRKTQLKEKKRHVGTRVVPFLVNCFHRKIHKTHKRNECRFCRSRNNA